MIIELIKNSDWDERGGKPGVKIFKNERKKLNFIFKLLQQIAAVQSESLGFKTESFRKEII